MIDSDESKGVICMKANRTNFEIALAKSCLTPQDLAKAADMPRPTLNNVISGRNVRPATLGRVARALGVPIEQIMEGGAADAEHRDM